MDCEWLQLEAGTEVRARGLASCGSGGRPRTPGRRGGAGAAGSGHLRARRDRAARPGESAA